MHKFLVRALSGIVYAAVIIFATVYGKWALVAMAITFSAIGIIEFDRMMFGLSKKSLPVVLLDVAGVITLIGIGYHEMIILIWIALMLLRNMLTRRFINNEVDLDFVKQIALALFGQLYLGIAFSMTVAIPWTRMPLLVFVMLWLNDSGAYIVGSLLGRHRMCPSISPKKTWEGFAGGAVVTIAGCLLLYHYSNDFFLMQEYRLWEWIMIAIICCVFGTLGDLLESKIKRRQGFKDSGHWIPGHGGLLDRIDSYLVAFPVTFIVTTIVDIFTKSYL